MIGEKLTSGREEQMQSRDLVSCGMGAYQHGRTETGKVHRNQITQLFWASRGPLIVFGG